MSIKVIGAGFPRTGTTTMKNALEILGYTKTYHFKDLIADPSRLKYWEDLENTASCNFEKLFDGYKATVDFPGYPYYRFLLKNYPNAKVILTIRDFEGWYKSTRETIWKAGPQTIFAKMSLMLQMVTNKNLRNTFKCIKFMRKIFLNKQFDNSFQSKVQAEIIFFKHINDVIANVPKDQLLIYEVAEGWAPLCEFLKVPIPSEQFPHLNKKENFHQMVSEMIKNASMK